MTWDPRISEAWRERLDGCDVHVEGDLIHASAINPATGRRTYATFPLAEPDFSGVCAALDRLPPTRAAADPVAQAA